MNYEKHYINLIDKYGIVSKPISGYYERHHILPKCVGGKDVFENLIYLDARCH